jgi:hypothetical protein
MFVAPCASNGSIRPEIGRRSDIKGAKNTPAPLRTPAGLGKLKEIKALEHTTLTADTRL